MTNLIDIAALIAERTASINAYAADLAPDFLELLDSDSAVIDDAIFDVASDNVDIYYGALREWLYKNDTADNCTLPAALMEDAVNEGLVDFDSYDFYEHIQAAQRLGNAELIRNSLDKILFIRALQIAAEDHENLTPEQLDELEEIDFSTLKTVGNIRDEVDFILDSEENDEEEA